VARHAKELFVFLVELSDLTVLDDGTPQSFPSGNHSAVL
jgi:hypothetical protein